jgi:DNA polymerase/3'-5' exonuclease PolX
VSNADLANLLDRLAGTLAEEGAPTDRVRAWLQASDAVRGLGTSVEKLLDEVGPRGLARLPGIGDGLALIITAMLEPPADDDEIYALAS